MTRVRQLITDKVGYITDPVVPVGQQGVCATLVTLVTSVQIPFNLFS